MTLVVRLRTSGRWPGQAKLTLSSSITRLPEASAVSIWKLALPRAAPCAFVPHRLGRTDPTLVTGTAGLDALADPDLFLGQLLVEPGVGRRFGGRLLLLVFKEAAVVALPVDQLTTVELHDAGGQRLQELTVVGNEQHGTAELQQHLLQPGNGMDVQVVGGLIQQQHIRLANQRL